MSASAFLALCAASSRLSRCAAFLPGEDVRPRALVTCRLAGEHGSDRATGTSLVYSNVHRLLQLCPKGAQLTAIVVPEQTKASPASAGPLRMLATWGEGSNLIHVIYQPRRSQKRNLGLGHRFARLVGVRAPSGPHWRAFRAPRFWSGSVCRPAKRSTAADRTPKHWSGIAADTVLSMKSKMPARSQADEPRDCAWTRGSGYSGTYIRV